MRHVARRFQYGRALWVSMTLIVGVGKLSPSEAQSVYYSRGQNIAPAFEGWQESPDGTFDMIFGYLNRNLDELFHIPVGPNNNIEPGGPDQGQPTYFLPTRNHYVFRVKVPKDFGKKELVWTITVNGKTDTAYGTLRPEYVTNDVMMQGNFGGDRNHDT